MILEKPEYIVKKRAEFRGKYGSVLSNSYLNAFTVGLIFACSLIYSALKINWSGSTFLILPVAFLYGEIVFYLAHRFQQHKKVRIGEWAFEMHTLWHHGMFSNENMDLDSPKDMNMVILPFFIYIFILGFLYLPVGYVLDLYFSTDIGWIVLFAITLHFIWYEFVHTLSHVENPPILKKLAKHHRDHHDPRLMGQYNFGIGTIFLDRIFGTVYPGKGQDHA